MIEVYDAVLIDSSSDSVHGLLKYESNIEGKLSIDTQSNHMKASFTREAQDYNINIDITNVTLMIFKKPTLTGRNVYIMDAKDSWEFHIANEKI